MVYRFAILGVLGLVVLAAVAATVAVVVAPSTTLAAYRGIAFSVPKDWNVQRRPTCISGSTKLVLTGPTQKNVVDTITVSQAVHETTAVCPSHVHAEPGGPPIKEEHIVVHGLAVTALEAPGGPVQWAVPTLKLNIEVQGTGPSVMAVLRSVHRA